MTPTFCTWSISDSVKTSANSFTTLPSIFFFFRDRKTRDSCCASPTPIVFQVDRHDIDILTLMRCSVLGSVKVNFLHHWIAPGAEVFTFKWFFIWCGFRIFDNNEQNEWMIQSFMARELNTPHQFDFFPRRNSSFCWQLDTNHQVHDKQTFLVVLEWWNLPSFLEHWPFFGLR